MTQADARSCGQCTVCCTLLAIETPELRKLPGVACQHCTAQGCGIYETRYPICRTYYCGWFGLPDLDESWRPDRSGVLLSPHDGGIELLVFGGEGAIRRPAFVPFVATLLSSRTPVFLAIPGPAGRYPARVQLNAALTRFADNPFQLTAGLLSALRAATDHRFEPMTP